MTRAIAMLAAIFSFFCGTASAQTSASGVILYDRADFTGEPRDFSDAVADLRTFRFDGRARSLIVDARTWEICDEADFQGRCARVSQDTPNLAAIEFDQRVRSIRPVTERPPPAEASARGRTAAFYATPQVDPCVRQDAGRACLEETAARFCQRNGFREARYFSSDRRRRGEARLQDVLCVR
ncbi:MAG: beta/gamma crystallin-related protein [Hyphomonadaceae bacterium]